MNIIILGAAVVILVIAIIVFFNRNGSNNASDDLKIKLAKAEQQVVGLIAERDNIAQQLQNERLRLEAGLARLNQELLAEKNLSTKAEEALKAQRERLAEQDVYLQQVQQKFKHEFENIANKLLDEKSAKFTEHNRSSMDIILNPFKDKLKDFEEKVDKVYKVEADERNILKGVITQLMELNNR